MSAGELRVTIWGARGSLPNPVAATQRYGGATTCLELETPDQIPLVFDGGSGLFDLGLELNDRRLPSRQIHLFFTHTHWDHVMGLPLFLPLYDASWTVHIYSLGGRRVPVHEVFSNVYTQRYFPVCFEHLDAAVRFHELAFEDPVVIGDTTVRCCRANHPGFALGFRADHGGRSLFFASDTAPFTEMLFGDRFHLRERETRPGVLNQMAALEQRLEASASGVDLLLHDGNYTDDEYRKLFHFGHASMSQAYELAQRCGARRLVLWHHDRNRSDDELDEVVAPTIARGAREGLIVEPARQGTTYHLPLSDTSITCTTKTS